MADEPTQQRAATTIGQAALSRPQAPSPVAAAETGGLTPLRILLLAFVVGAALLSGAIVKIATAWQRRSHGRRRTIDWTTEPRLERRAGFPRGRADAGRPAAGQGDLQHTVEEALRQLMRTRADIEAQLAAPPAFAGHSRARQA
jgi:hypothetical protein